MLFQRADLRKFPELQQQWAAILFANMPVSMIHTDKASVRSHLEDDGAEGLT